VDGHACSTERSCDADTSLVARLQLYQPHSDRDTGEMSAVLRAKLQPHVIDVLFNRSRSNAEPDADLFGGVALDCKLKHGQFAFCKCRIFRGGSANLNRGMSGSRA
jgi:hypothetical protein